MVNSQSFTRLLLGINIFSLQWIQTFQQVNLALNGIAKHSSDYNSAYIASNAIDGNRASHMFQHSCTHTQFETDPWWRVDLLAVYAISTVSITNRGDCCSIRISGAEIRIGNSWVNNGNNNPKCVTINSIAAGATATFTCNLVGRYVNILFLGVDQVATVCEVEVYGTLVVPVFRTTYLNVKFNSSEDLKNPTLRDNALPKIQTAVAQPSLFRVRWRKEPELESDT